MHYYKRNLGDYAKKAGRLSMLQHGAFTLLIDACYDREVFPTMDEAIDWTWASSAAEIEAVEFVLRKFFTLEGGVYVQKRIKEEVEAYRALAETNARIARERETNRANNSTKRARSVNEAPPNHKPLTINQESCVSDAGQNTGSVDPTHAVFEDLGNGSGSGSGPGSALAEVVARAMAAAGLADVSASHPKLVALLDAGLAPAELVAAATNAASKGQGFAYAMARAEGRRRDAAATAALPDAPAVAAVDPDSRAGIESSAVALGLPGWNQAAEQWPQFAGRVRRARAGAVAA